MAGRKRSASKSKKSSRGKSNTSGARKSQTKRAANSSGNKAVVDDGSDLGIVAKLVSVVFICVLFIANFGVLGSLGDAISDAQFGIIGTLAYGLPIVFLVVFLLLSTDWLTSVMQQIIALVAAYIDVAILLHMPVLNEQQASELGAFTFCAREHTGGGVIGGAIAEVLSKGIGNVGAWIVIIAIMLMCITFVFNINWIEVFLVVKAILIKLYNYLTALFDFSDEMDESDDPVDNNPEDMQDWTDDISYSSRKSKASKRRSAKSANNDRRAKDNGQIFTTFEKKEPSENILPEEKLYENGSDGDEPDWIEDQDWVDDQDWIGGNDGRLNEVDETETEKNIDDDDITLVESEAELTPAETEADEQPMAADVTTEEKSIYQEIIEDIENSRRLDLYQTVLESEEFDIASVLSNLEENVNNENFESAEYDESDESDEEISAADYDAEEYEEEAYEEKIYENSFDEDDFAEAVSDINDFYENASDENASDENASVENTSVENTSVEEDFAANIFDEEDFASNASEEDDSDINESDINEFNGNASDEDSFDEDDLASNASDKNASEKDASDINEFNENASDEDTSKKAIHEMIDENEEFSINNSDKKGAASKSGKTAKSDNSGTNKQDEKKSVRRLAPTNKNGLWHVPVYNKKRNINEIDKLLNRPSNKITEYTEAELENTAMLLKETLESFGVKVEIDNYSKGPAITRFEIIPAKGVKVSRILNLADDIQLSLAARSIRIEAPIPGMSAVGIEIPNKSIELVSMHELLTTSDYQSPAFKDKLAFAVGKGLSGAYFVSNIGKMPHVLIAGATGSGKSVCINTLIVSLLFKYTPDELKLLMIDPKVVELSVYNGIPHLLIPVITDTKQAASALAWCVNEMDDRYIKFAEAKVRDLAGYNKKIYDAVTFKDGRHPENTEEYFKCLKENHIDEASVQNLPMSKIVVIVDELADLMMTAGKEVEGSICRLAQLARACGIHLVIATQRPSVDVITGLIKANMPSRIAFSVSSGTDSRTILDMVGAEKLLGNGDMLFLAQGQTKPYRLQGAFVSDEEVMKVVDFWAAQINNNDYDEVMTDNQEQVSSTSVSAAAGSGAASAGAISGAGGSGDEDLLIDAAKFIIEKDKASIGMLQRKFRIGFNRAARIMDELCEKGVVGEEEGTKPRRVLMDNAQFENALEAGEF